ncbi:LEAF RUST 10 DISEASE-RESISTANCE LOCUS RECEPTOR-LIKE PROTEIN KINASE-like 1.2 isoform X2 [Cajanus cajan]|uniref:LEAF RUST 10 DISEASE-RESISTANCE LOCUS RECEPTOR-LIKE PROTEIN KINASE-like 1.2 isoform X2 n=1 Tax=Cajanus cajan TaxID=3821 RepID=UPI00098D90E2|nr:LEAF RUST 10 DISEASE-RESISTANCE LOCUS RECEPTOR-LIKE PROTEIN KINASE-like 1.2 isoform X2 [Cajanus cajan]
MNLNTLFFILKPFSSPLILSHIVLFYLIATNISCSVDPKFDACPSKTCGNQNISYPFYIQGIQEPFCGYPGFGISCDPSGFPILNLSNTQYIIHQIFYQNKTLRVSNLAFSNPPPNTTKPCLPRTQNLTTGNLFSVAPNQKGVILFYGCDLSSSLEEHRVGCYAEKESSSVVALYEEDKNIRSVTENCTGEGVATTTVADGIGGIRESLRKGLLLTWTASDCNTCTSTGGRCGFDLDPRVYAFRCFCTDRVHSAKCGLDDPVPEKRSHLKAKLLIGLGIGVPCMLVIGLLFLFLHYKRKHAISGEQMESRYSYSDSSSNPHGQSGSEYFGVPLYSYAQLKEATSNFDHTKELGDGGFGTVYHGKLPDGREVAVKRLYEHNYRRVEQFMNEVRILTRLRHKHLVSLYGCTSRHSRELLLVYEYISNGTVACHLHGKLAKPGLLSWSARIKIAIETASALAYLHASDIIHRDVKTNNILLDNNYSVKVADFGLSRDFPNHVTHVSTAPQGTPGYLDPEYYNCYQLTNKSDVYSFGVVLIELISSKPAVDMNRSRDEINLSNLAVKKIQECEIGELVDPSLGFGSDSGVKGMIVSVAGLALQCLQREKDLRPSMEEVLHELRRIESGTDDVNGFGVSHSCQHSAPPAASPEWDEVGLLMNMKPTSPNTVTDKWESECTTPNVSA